MIFIIKKDKTIQPFDINKVVNAVNKSAFRVMYKFSDDEINEIETHVNEFINDPKNCEKIDGDDKYLTVPMMHNIVEKCLGKIAPEVAQSYRDYRDYKTSFVSILDSVYKKSQAIMYIGDKENSNSDSTLASTKRCLIYGQLNKELYQKFNLNTKMLQACRDGYIYIHDMSSRRDGINCCLFDVANVLKGGFEMGNIWYNEPKSLDTAFDVIGDIILSAASQQYGGFTVPRIDEIVAEYAEKTYEKYIEKYYNSKLHSVMNVMGYTSEDDVYQNFKTNIREEAEKEAWNDVRRDMDQGFQGLEIKLNTVASSRGDYPFTTFTIGVSTNKFAQLAAEMCLEVRKKGQGAPGKKKCVLFPKLVFTYTEDLHGEGKELNWLFEKALDCSMKAMYPDYLSLDGDTTTAKMWHTYGEVIAPMGCVDGDSTIQIKGYSLFGLDYNILSFERLWEALQSDSIPNNGIKVQPGRIEDLYAEPDDLYVWDINKNDYTKVKKVIRNVETNWLDLTFVNEYESEEPEKHLICTYDHPLPVIDKGRTKAENLSVGNKIIGRTYECKTKCEYTLKYIQPVYKKAYSYDVETESDRFMVNGLDSHNCRAFLSPYYERGGRTPADENDRPFFTGRFNIGAVSLHLPMIYAKAKQENRDFYEVLDEYLQLIREVHIMTYNYLAEIKASTNPIAFCQGGFHNGYLKPSDKIKPLLKYSTASFGITALNELNRIHNGKSIREDGEFPIEVLKHINKRIAEYKEEDNINYAIYGTPAESLCFSGDEYIQTYEGNKKIKDIKVGDLVYSFNEEQHKIELKKVIRSMKTSDSAKVVRITFDNEQSVVCTPNHPFAVRKMVTDSANRYKEREVIEWTRADELKEGTCIKSNYIHITVEENHKVVSVEFLEEEIPTYNIEVEDNHNFFVGGDDGILVHNCGTQVKQFRQKYGIVENVSDREYVSNSFHCHVSEDIDGIEKQDKEFRFWELSQGGRIQYVKYDINYNKDAIRAYVKRAMRMGLYEGVNFTLCYCENCGKEGVAMDVCPECGSSEITKIERMNGYLSYSRVHGDTRLNSAKMAEIADRKSM